MGLQRGYVTPVFDEDQKGRIVAISVHIMGDAAVFSTGAGAMFPAEGDQFCRGVPGWVRTLPVTMIMGRSLFSRASARN
jgi:hypothetical protein